MDLSTSFLAFICVAFDSLAEGWLSYYIRCMAHKLNSRKSSAKKKRKNGNSGSNGYYFGSSKVKRIKNI